MASHAIRATLYEPRRRWWGAMRADVALDRVTRDPAWDDNVEIVQALARTSWKVPPNFKYRVIEAADG